MTQDEKNLHHSGDTNEKIDHIVEVNEMVDHISETSKMVEDEVEKLAEEYTKSTPDNDPIRILAFIKGYNKSKEKYKWTDDDMRKAFMKGISITGEGYNAEYAIGNSPDLETEFGNSADEYIQSLKQPKQ
jgi:hypothetical protein